MAMRNRDYSNVINLSTVLLPFKKGGPEGIYCNYFKIPLNPPLRKGDLIKGIGFTWRAILLDTASPFLYAFIRIFTPEY